MAKEYFHNLKNQTLGMVRKSEYFQFSQIRPHLANVSKYLGV